MCVNNTLDLVIFNIGGREVFVPSDKLENVPEIGQNSFVIINQRAPVWRYIKAFQHALELGAGVISTFDAGQKVAVVVASKIEGWNVDDVFKYNSEKNTISLEDRTNYKVS